MSSSQLTVGDLGEQGLLKRLQGFCPKEIIGDDAAVLEISPDRALVVTTDILVDGVHFSDRTTKPEDVGWRAAAANLSDLAAMGATPIGITVGLSLPGTVAVSWVESLYEGLGSCLQLYQTPIVGGDVCRSPVVTVSITAFGEVIPQQTIRRSSARLGDRIVVTGLHGRSRAGLELLLHPELGDRLTQEMRKSLVEAHQRPKPRLDVLPLLRSLTDSSRIAGMDSSDGLADAVVQICHCSGVGAELDRNAIAISPALSQLVSLEQALEWALYGGEDFELILCLPQPMAEALVEKLGEGAAIIGAIAAGNEVNLIDFRGVYPTRRLTLTEGFQHFST